MAIKIAILYCWEVLLVIGFINVWSVAFVELRYLKLRLLKKKIVIYYTSISLFLNKVELQTFACV